MFKKKNRKEKYKPMIQRSSLTDIIHASVFAGIVTAAFIMLGGIYALAPGSIVFYIILIFITGLLILLFAPINIIPEKIIKKYTGKPKTIHITGNKDQLNQISPVSIEIHPGMMKINNSYTRTFSINKYPPEIMDGWMAPVISSKENIVISMHIHPGNSEFVKANLDMEIGKIDALIRGMSETDPKAVPLNHLSAQLKNYRDMLIAGQTQPFNAEIYLTLKTKNRGELEENTKELTRWFKGRNIQLTAPYMKMDKATRSVLPMGVNYLNTYHSFDTHSLKTFFPFTRNVFGTEEGVIYGYTDDDNPVIFNRHSMRAPHLSVFGSTGSGKSYLLKLILSREYVYNPDMRFFIVDPTPLPHPDPNMPPMSEYTALTKRYKGQIIRFGTKTKNAPVINPFDIKTVSEKAEMPMTEKTQKLTSFFNIVFKLTPQETAMLETILPRVYRRKGIDDSINLPTYTDNDSPTFTDLQKELKKYLESEDAYTQDKRICEKLIRLLEPWVTGAYSTLNKQTNISIQARWILFDISLLRNTPMFKPLTYLIMDFIDAQVKQTLQPKFCLFDEVHLFLDVVDKELERMLREYRKYAAGVCLATQSAEDFIQTSSGRAILDNCPVSILLKHDNIGEGMQKRWGFTPAEQNLIKRAATGAQGYSEALFIAENSRSKLLIHSFPFEHEIITTKPEEIIERGGNIT